MSVIHPYSLDLLKMMGVYRKLALKSWDEFSVADAPELDFVFTVCDNAASGNLPGLAGQQMTARPGGIPDPAVTDPANARRTKPIAWCSTGSACFWPCHLLASTKYCKTGSSKLAQKKARFEKNDNATACNSADAGLGLLKKLAVGLGPAVRYWQHIDRYRARCSRRTARLEYHLRSIWWWRC
jgi:hypothetical protein